MTDRALDYYTKGLPIDVRQRIFTCLWNDISGVLVSYFTEGDETLRGAGFTDDDIRSIWDGLKEKFFRVNEIMKENGRYPLFFDPEDPCKTAAEYFDLIELKSEEDLITKFGCSFEEYVPEERKEKDMTVQFVCEDISAHVKRIRDGSDVCEYLVIGDKEAMLIDTGYGIGDLKGFIETITDLPVKVYITHGHVDHASGTYPFEEVHMSHLDEKTFREHTVLSFRKENLERSALQLEDKDYLPEDPRTFIDITDGETVDLGDVHVEMIHVPGHTMGTFVPLILEDRIAMFGDATGVGTLICLDQSASVKEYLNSLRHLKTYEPLYDTVLRQHGTCTSSKALLDENIENCELILARKDDHVPVEFMGKECFWARKRDTQGNRADGKEGNILYKAENN